MEAPLNFVSVWGEQVFGSSWSILHGTGDLYFGTYNIAFLLYAIVPWVNVMSLGYILAPLFKWEKKRQNKVFLVGSFCAWALFILLRGFNLYGDPYPWPKSGEGLLTILNAHKYPPSLAYLLMTLGSAGLLASPSQQGQRPMPPVFSRFWKSASLLLCHAYLPHSPCCSGRLRSTLGFSPGDFLGHSSTFPEEWGLSLPVVYLIWGILLAILYFPSRWFMHLKARKKSWWLSYL